ncbi:hypothetical protein [Streptomyces olivoreticuli]|uniref:hypothetical protein n=1 Tax=Streptomyces olivoreticuli TaxID=68246 RepID=UPI001F076913|nr:hypothetical protein [Streptomyces olivoreticuli]
MRDIRVGGTYVVNVPQRVPPAVGDRVRRGREEFAAGMRLHLHRGRRFEITVTEVHADTRTVDGFESVTTSKVALPLTAEQAEALGLPESEEAYRIEGLVLDGEGASPAPCRERPRSTRPAPQADSPRSMTPGGRQRSWPTANATAPAR